MKRLLLSVAAVAMCASLAFAADAPKPAAKPKAAQPATAKPAAPAQVKDSAIQQIDQFIAGAKIDKKNPAWKTSLPKPPQATFDKTHTYFARMVTTKGPILIEFLPERGPDARHELHLPDPARLLRRRPVPPRHHRLHGAGRLPARHRHRRPGLRLRRRVQPRR